jgi:hypothetical protein
VFDVKGGRRKLALLGGAVLVALAAVVLVGSTQIGGCCGGSPTHGCKFVETPDAAMDAMVSDAAINCPSAPCPSGESCCIENNPANPVHCIAVGGTCMGPTGSCRGDQDCPVGANAHCCGNVDDLTTQCQTPCSGQIDTDHSIRICLSNAECPPDLPVCAGFMVDGRMFFGCAKASN